MNTKKPIYLFFLILLFLLFKCGKKEKSHYSEIKSSNPKYIYNTLKENNNGLIVPIYNFIDSNYHSFNKDIKGFYYNYKDFHIKSFLAFPEKYIPETFVSFSDDTISINQNLQIYIYDNTNSYVVFHHNIKLNENDKIGKVKEFYIPVLKAGFDTVIVKNVSTNKDITFKYFVTLKNRVRNDSLLFYLSNSLSEEELNALKQIVKNE